MDRTSLIDEKSLKEWSGYKRRTDLIHFLMSNRIMFFQARDGSVITTQTAVDHPLVSEQPEKYGAIDFL